MKRKRARKAAEILILRPVRFVAGRVKFILLILAVMFLGANSIHYLALPLRSRIVIWRSVGKWEKIFLPKSAKAPSDLSPNLTTLPLY